MNNNRRRCLVSNPEITGTFRDIQLHTGIFWKKRETWSSDMYRFPVCPRRPLEKKISRLLTIITFYCILCFLQIFFPLFVLTGKGLGISTLDNIITQTNIVQWQSFISI